MYEMCCAQFYKMVLNSRKSLQGLMFGGMRFKTIVFYWSTDNVENCSKTTGVHAIMNIKVNGYSEVIDVDNVNNTLAVLCKLW